MDTSQLLRDARRHAGLSQRQPAAASGVSLRTVVDAEAARRRLSVALLDALLAACGLDAVLSPRADAGVCVHIERHLRLSTTARLHLSLGGDGADLRHGPPLWIDLVRLAQCARVLLDGPAAVGTWIPGTPVPQELTVGVRDGRRRQPLPVGETLRVRGLLPAQGGPGWRTAVHIVLPHHGVVLVPPPADLLLDPRCEQHAVALRAAGRCLHQLAGRDDGGRRGPPHRDPDERGEVENLSRALTYAMDSRRLPVPTDSRGWRLDAPVSLAQWHERNGHPTRRGGRRTR